MSGLSEKEKTMLLSGAGRIGGKPALKVIEASLGRQGSGPPCGGPAGTLQLA